MPSLDLDSNTEYKRQRIEAAQQVELWIQADRAVLDIFRERIRFAVGPFQLSERRWKEVDRRVKRRRLRDEKAAWRNPRLRDKQAGPPGPEYVWRNWASYENYNRPTEEGFRQMQQDGFVGTWESVKQAWEAKAWGYWMRKPTEATALWEPIPWMQTERVGDSLRIVSYSDSGKALALHYAVLTAIHDTDLQGVTKVSGTVWPDLLRRAVHQRLLGFLGDKEDLVQTALKTVGQDIDKTLRARERPRIPASETAAQGAGASVTLEQFMRDYCETARYTDAVLESRKTCLFKASLRKAIELPKHVGRWKKGKPKYFRPTDLSNRWLSYRALFPNLPCLKSELRSGQTG
jgi:hypothetical protein